MNRKVNRLVLLACIVVMTVATACGGATSTRTAKVEGVEWNVTVSKVVALNDAVLGIDTDRKYTLADTATVNTALKGIRHCGNVTIGWTLPGSDGSIWLVAYENEPLLSESVRVTEASSIPSYGGDIQVAFKFPDAHRWEEITGENIGNRLAVIVNGQLMNAPQVNMEITSGNCAVSIPADMIHDFLPSLDLENLKQ